MTLTTDTAVRRTRVQVECENCRHRAILRVDTARLHDLERRLVCHVCKKTGGRLSSAPACAVVVDE